MKKITITTLAILTILLSGCSLKKETSIQKSGVTETKESSSVEDSKAKNKESVTTRSSQDNSPVVLWNSEKARELNQFVIDWGKTMNQTYREYTPEHNVYLYDLQLPKRVLTKGEGWQAVIDDVPINLEWSSTGEGQGYALVAVFSDADTQPYLEKHVYFFTIVSGEPKVLLTMQNQGNENNYLYFRETENQELKNGFSKLVTGNENPKVDTESKAQVNLGTIAYKDLDKTDFIQRKAQWLGCSIEDDGATLNFVPAMSATIQNLQLYISGQGNEEYYNNCLDEVKEVSLKTGGKPVSFWSSGGGKVVITAKNGAITFRL